MKEKTSPYMPDEIAHSIASGNIQDGGTIKVSYLDEDVVCHYQRGHSYEDIGCVYNISAATVKAIINRLLEHSGLRPDIVKVITPGAPKDKLQKVPPQAFFCWLMLMRILKVDAETGLIIRGSNRTDPLRSVPCRFAHHEVLKVPRILHGG